MISSRPFPGGFVFLVEGFDGEFSFFDLDLYLLADVEACFLEPVAAEFEAGDCCSLSAVGLACFADLVVDFQLSGILFH